jgi:hypothetical protein
VADQLALSLEATRPGIYRERGAGVPQRLFHNSFAEFSARYKINEAPPSQKRTLLFGEYMNKQLLLVLPHRHVICTLCGASMHVLAAITDPQQV